MSCVGRACNNAATAPVSACHASVVRGCVPLSSSSSLVYHFWFLKHHHSAATPHHHRPCWRSCRTHENCINAEQIIIIFYIFYFIFCSMCLVLFSIVLYRTIVTVYTDNNFLYDYLRQMHQIIIHLSPLGCLSPARGKTVQKNRAVSGVKVILLWCLLFIKVATLAWFSTTYPLHQILGLIHVLLHYTVQCTISRQCQYSIQ